MARQRLDNAGIKVRDFDEMLEEKRRRRSAGKDAVAATRARAAGRGPEEVREIYMAELRARNLKVPEDRVLDAVVEYITTGNRLPAIRGLSEILLETGKEIHDDMSRFRGHHTRDGSTDSH